MKVVYAPLMTTTEAPAVTATVLRALQIVGASDGGTGGAAFADRMWPDSYGHHRLGRVGYGVTKGPAMPRAGGALLSRIERLGLIARTYDSGYTPLYRLTAAGKALLDREGHDVPKCGPHNGLHGKSLPYPDSHLFVCRDCGETVPWKGYDR